LHDVGKFAEAFQNVRDDLFLKLHGRQSTRRYTQRHDKLGLLLWKQLLWPHFQEQNPSGVEAGGEPWMWDEIMGLWASAVMGHHGEPTDPWDLRLKDHFTETDRCAAQAFTLEATSVFLKDGRSLLVPATEDHWQAAKRFSWLLAGIAVLCDWIGSDERHFEYEDKPIPLDEYWHRALGNAEIALADAGILPVPISTINGMSELYPEIVHPSPLQDHTDSCALARGSQLWIAEDITGSGKTEAALVLAYRLMKAGFGEGVFVALPTMATANAMYERLAKAYRLLFQIGGSPSLVLSHGFRHLSDSFRRSVLQMKTGEQTSYSKDDESSSAECSAWIADSRKKALLAHVGVGTIDQALLAVLPSRHQSLRLFGLARKVLIIDEVHACDAYMNGILENLLRFQAGLGGSAILLSATLPQQTREKLTRAFCEGLNQRCTSVPTGSYPLVTRASASGVETVAVDPRQDLRRAVRIEIVNDVELVKKSVLDAFRKGGCVCWVRNTVADALQGYLELQPHLSSDQLILFHARLAMGDRLEREKLVLKTFGKHSTAQDRHGKVLVATQVVEQSLDLDFDLMITDLAPIDLLIQRAGRLHRHPRDSTGNPLPSGAADERGGLRMLVHGPIPVPHTGADWYSAVFPKAAYVYPLHGQLWLTARLLAERGGWILPDDARDLIEQVYAEDPFDMPEALASHDQTPDGKRRADRALARLNGLNFHEGYQRGLDQWQDDTMTPSRLGANSVTVRLARWDGTRLEPWFGSSDHPWEMSQVSVREALVHSEADPDTDELRQAMDTAKIKMPDRGKWSILVPLRQEETGRWTGRAINKSGKDVLISYSPEIGLDVTRDGGVNDV
ncbi:MAG: CRISPR-associated helicase Cas3', partial [Desulfomonilaceae bacterium]